MYEWEFNYFSLTSDVNNHHLNMYKHNSHFLEIFGITVFVSFRSGKVIAGDNEQSSVSNIYAIGDILEGKLELTPVAIHAGKLLARRLFGGSNKLVSISKLAGVLHYSCRSAF